MYDINNISSQKMQFNIDIFHTLRHLKKININNLTNSV